MILKEKIKISSLEDLNAWLKELSDLFEKNIEPNPSDYLHFLQSPEDAYLIIKLMQALKDSPAEVERGYYSACVFALELWVLQLQSAVERQNKSAEKLLRQLMIYLADTIDQGQHSVGFWLPVLSIFYEAHVELIDELKDAYFNLAIDGEEAVSDQEAWNENSIRELISELSDLSVFDIAENFFAQSYAMPPDFFEDLLLDLYSIEEGQDIGLLLLLHPKQEVRDVVVATLETLMPNITLSPPAFARLQAIKRWYPVSYEECFNRWIKLQRKKNADLFLAFSQEHPESVRHPPTKEHSEAAEQSQVSITHIKASEVDGSGAQGIFIQLRKKRENRLCGLLLKQNLGIKEAWITPAISTKDVGDYYKEAFDDSIMLRKVDLDYVRLVTNHFLALTLEQGGMPNLHLLEMQEVLGITFLPQKIDINYQFTDLSVQINPFTPETLQASLKRSKSWVQNKRMTESWFIENSHIDTLVNRCCCFVNGVKVCRFEDAMESVLTQDMEVHRNEWLFHFLWVALWIKAYGRKYQRLWQDSFLIAYAIHDGMPLKDIPILQEICRQSVINSIETMQERRTHLASSNLRIDSTLP